MSASSFRSSGLLFAAGRSMAIASLTTAALSFSLSGASAAGLFEALPASAAATVAADRSPVVMGERIVRLDTAYMEDNIAPLGADTAKDRLSRAAKAPSITVELADDLTVDMSRRSLKKASGRDGGYVWSGRMADDSVGYAVMVISGGQTTGQILYKGRLFRIQPISGDIHRITEIDESKFPPEQFVRSPNSAPASGPQDLSAPAGKSTIKVLIPYTKKAKQEAGNIKQTAKLAISLANTGAKNGGASIRYKLAGTFKTKYKESSHQSDLYAIQGGGGKAKDIHKQRKKKKADLVAMLRVSDSGSGICGIGFFNENTTPSDRPYGFSVTSVNCVTYHSVAHEMGHNIGLEHDRYVVTQPPKGDYNFGYSNVGKQIRSIMAYANECNAKIGTGCTRVPMYSSSKKKYQGNKLGEKKKSKGRADASKVLTVNGKAVKKFY